MPIGKTIPIAALAVPCPAMRLFLETQSRYPVIIDASFGDHGFLSAMAIAARSGVDPMIVAMAASDIAGVPAIAESLAVRLKTGRVFRLGPQGWPGTDIDSLEAWSALPDGLLSGGAEMSCRMVLCWPGGKGLDFSAKGSGKLALPRLRPVSGGMRADAAFLDDRDAGSSSLFSRVRRDAATLVAKTLHCGGGI